ncbi:TPA: ErmCL family antibiotic resistance leader peptide [Streptococcus agalactiae]
MYCSSRYYFISFIMKKIKGGKGMDMFSIFVIERFHYPPNQKSKPKIIGYNELLRLVHYNRQGEGYNETEKPEKYAKFHYI